MGRKSVGSIVFPIPVYVCFLAAEWRGETLLFYIPVLLLTISDTVAEWCGRYWTGRKGLQAGRKTIAGSCGFAFSALAIIIICGAIHGRHSIGWIALAVVVALASTLAEKSSKNGWDNITVPFAALLILLATI